MRTNPPEDMTDEEVADCISRNVEHLELMVAKRLLDNRRYDSSKRSNRWLKIKGFKLCYRYYREY